MKSNIKPNKPKIVLSIGMIVKNEGENLGKCLSALQPLRDAVPCELVITDTGSTDDTVEIAERYDARVLRFAWCDDFAEARNFGLRECTGEWFMFLDGDEVFGDLRSLISFFGNSKLRAKYDVASYIQRNFHSYGNPDDYSDLATPRIAKITRSLRFEAAVHEMLNARGLIYTSDSYVEHYGYVGAKNAEKEERNNVILRRILQNDPNNADALINYISPSVPDYKTYLTERATWFKKNGEYKEKLVILMAIASRFRLADSEFALFACKNFYDVCRERRPVYAEVVASEYVALKNLSRTDESVIVLAELMRLLRVIPDVVTVEDGTWGLVLITTPSVLDIFRKDYAEFIITGRCGYDDAFTRTLTPGERELLYDMYYGIADKTPWYRLFADKNGTLAEKQAYLQSREQAVSGAAG
ncbi:hypothetical protein FACS1894133_5700 [Clostridia bacterium]|nr:hypothetical protein FACS1894133_5700 [Clostridia bacterium]